MGEPINSMCAVYAELVDHELKKDDPDMATVQQLLGYIKEYCGTVAYKKGETPAHLEEYLIEKGSTETGTVVVDGKKVPRAALDLADRE